LNGRKLCRAGVGPDGVLSAIVTWTKLTGAAARQARRLKSPIEETRLDVGGLRGGVHRTWAAQPLRVGDEVAVGIQPAGRGDRPAVKKTRDRRPAPDRESTTTFMNVDLDIWSAAPLDPLLAGLGRHVSVLHSGKEGRRYVAHLEVAGSGLPEHTADQLIQRFVRLIRRLPPRLRSVWNRAKIRDFNIGIQAEHSPYSYEVPLDPATLRAAASVKARVVVTVYAAGWTNARRGRRRS
jgi:hypothetical protein